MSEINVQQKSAYFVRKTPVSNAQNVKTPINVLNIPGTRTSLQNNQLLTPIGIPSLDFFIGGGLPVGGICLVGQDKNNTYSDIINRCFIAEGVVHKHSIYVADLLEEKNKLFQRIPSVNKLEEPEVDSKQNDQLRIAWRYGQQQQPQQKIDSSAKSFQSNYFTMNKLMTMDDVYSSSNVKTFELNEQDKDLKNIENSTSSLYSKLALDIKSHIDSINLNINKTKQYTNILRIVINSAGGLMWNDMCTLNEDYSVDFCKFLLFLRELLRHSLAVCIITVPNEVVMNTDLMERFSHLSDYVFVMDDSSTSVSRLTNTQYDGLFRLAKLPRLNSLNSCFIPETLDLAFYIKRKRLVIEQMHLPPELGENDDSQKGRTNTSVTMSCSSSGSGSGSNKLDF